MEDDFWNNLIEKEEKGILEPDMYEGEEPEMFEAYEDEISPDQMGGEDDFDEFDDYQEPEEDNFQMSYSQMTHINYGDPSLGTTMGGKYSKLEKMIRQDTVSKEKLYILRLKAELSNWFSYTKTDHYSIITENIPRYWLKSPQALAAVYYMTDHHKKITQQILAKYSNETNVPKTDLYRYYRLVKDHI